VVLEKVPLILQGRPDRLALFDIPLTSVDDGDVTESQGDDPAGKNVYDVGSLVPASFSKRKRKQNMLSRKIGGGGIRKAIKSTHIRSTLVNTPIVLVPSGSTSLAIFNPSEFAKSVFAAVTAKMIAFGLLMNFNSISLICLSMSLG
jgi:hypothetical protein